MAEDRDCHAVLETEVAEPLHRLGNLAARHGDILTEAMRTQLAKGCADGSARAPERVGMLLVLRELYIVGAPAKYVGDLLSLPRDDLLVAIDLDQQERLCLRIESCMEVLFHK